MPDILRKASHVGIVGGSGSGKTELAIRYAVGSRHDRVFIYDHQQEFSQRLGKLAVTTTAFELIRDHAERQRIVIYDPTEEFPGNFNLGLAEWAQHVWQLSRIAGEVGGETLVVIDELQKLVNPANTPTEVKMLVQTGRKWGLDTCFVSQQPNRLPNEILEQWTALHVFRLKTENSRDALEQLGFDREMIDRVSTLPDLNYFHVNLLTGETVPHVISFSG